MINGKIFAIASLIIFFWLLPVCGQGERGSISGGIRVATMTEYSKPWPVYIKRYSQLGRKEIRSHSVFANTAEKTYFGYDLKVEAHDVKDKFRVTIKRLSIRPKNKFIDTSTFAFRDLPNYPGTFVVKDGETIVLDILENPETKEKITNLIRITRKISGPVFADLHRAADFTLDDVNLKLFGYEVFIDNKKIHSSRGGGSGGNIGIYLPGHGRFIMSPFRRKGYKFQKIGLIVNNKITFSYGNKTYKIVAKSLILGEGGKWHAWVLFEPDYIPTKKYHSPSEPMTQSGSIEGFFPKGQ